MKEIIRCTVYQFLHVLDDEIEYEIWSNKYGLIRRLESLENRYINSIKMDGRILIIYID